jgi:hypothetical protein
LQAIDHDLGVFAPERAAQRGFAFGEGGEDQRAIGDAFGAGHGDVGLDGRGEWDNFNDVGQRHADLFGRGTALALPLVTPLFGFGEEFFDAAGIAFFEGAAKILEAADEAGEFAEEVLAIADGDVAPHFRGTGGDAGGVAKAVGAQQGLIFRAIGAEDVIDQLRGEDVRQMAGAADQFVVRFG